MPAWNESALWTTAVISNVEARPMPRVVVREDLNAAARSAASDTATLLADYLTRRDEVHLVLTGGRGGAAVCSVLPASLEVAGVRIKDFARIHLWFGDERFVPAGHKDRNDNLADALLRSGVPEANCHRVLGPDSVSTVEEAASRYDEEFATSGPRDGLCDVLHVGLGPDGHIASLFPSHPDACVIQGSVIPVHHSPKPPAERVSLTFPVIQSARHVMVLAGGHDKAYAVGQCLTHVDPATWPGSCARGLRSTSWYVDETASIEIPHAIRSTSVSSHRWA
ncbi:6-phosphogluconolactonase [Actinomyces vulturis]|uniref:6-phosphogluconolactonase n=1 Tax=Actinomyces vulturis TaxID=1857645 RepID=UPI00083593C9|nr:6-phosphogluconolactonase [Actinomyces vulturis]